MQNKIVEYIHNNARPIDKYLFSVLQDGADKLILINELKKYQNEDGGFGHGIEPDIQSPASTPLSTSVALQYIIKSKIEDNDFLMSVFSYLEKSYDDSYGGWHRITKGIEEHPHAPWWNYDEKKESQNWPNPNAEIIGYLNYFKNKLNKNLLDKLELLNNHVQKILVNDNPIDEVHDLLCFKRSFEIAPNMLAQQNKERLFESIERVVETDSSKWVNYVPRPLDFIDSPKSPFINIFPMKLIQKNLEYLKQTLNTDHWEPTWSWGEDSQGWSKAKKDWSGHITVKNVLLLKNFGIDLNLVFRR